MNNRRFFQNYLMSPQKVFIIQDLIDRVQNNNEDGIDQLIVFMGL